MHDEHGRLFVDGGGDLDRRAGIDRRVLEHVHVGGKRAGAVDIDGVAVRLGARHVFGGDVADGAGLVLDDHGTIEQRPHFFGEVAHDHVGAAAGRKRADEMHVLGWILLRVNRGGT
jgi:hypothetical protein